MDRPGLLPAIRVGPRRVRVRGADLESFLAAPATVPGSPLQPRSEQASGHEAEEGPAGWAELGEALDASRSALADDDRAELVRALDALADAAASLAAAIRTRPSGSA